MLKFLSRFNYAAASGHRSLPPAMGGDRHIVAAFFEGVRMSYLTIAFLFIVVAGAAALGVAAFFDAAKGDERD